MAKASPTQRALAHCKAQGWAAAIVERWNQYAKIRQDLFGFADLVVLRPQAIVAVQVTSGSNHAARRTKILAEPRAKMWHDCGGVVEVWSYTKRKTGRYEMRVEEVSFDADV